MQLVPLGLQNVMDFGQSCEVDVEERVVSENGVHFLHFPDLLLVALIVLLVADGDEIGHTHADCEEGFVRVTAFDEFGLFAVIVAQIALQIEDKVLFAHLALRDELQLTPKLLKVVNGFASGGCAEGKCSSGDIL